MAAKKIPVDDLTQRFRVLKPSEDLAKRLEKIAQDEEERAKEESEVFSQCEDAVAEFKRELRNPSSKTSMSIKAHVVD